MLYEKSNAANLEILKIKHLLKESNGQILEIKIPFEKSKASTFGNETLKKKMTKH